MMSHFRRKDFQMKYRRQKPDTFLQAYADQSVIRKKKEGCQAEES